MAERVMAALDYLDAHNSFLKQKQRRPLGDIDSKYDVSSFDLPLHLLLNDRVALTGTSRTNLSPEKTIDEILKEDRQKVVRSAQRSSSATFQKNLAFSRPQTSLSSGSAVMNGDNRRRSFRGSSHGGSSTTSRTSTKKITFTPPGVNVGPTDARDEVMEEIVNKPLTHTPAKSRNGPTPRCRTAASAPVLGQQNRVAAAGSRSMTSLRRSKTFHSSSRLGEQQKKFETKPGPFTTIKVTGPDMWVISSSTPTSYFDGDLPDQATTIGGSVTVRQSTWEDTANSVPREEKKSPPRYQRQLGAPPQFGPTHQWYSFTGGGPTKQRPVLTAFADETDNEYYSIESQVGQKVVAFLEGSPGIRIGVNGEVVAQSMKLNKKQSEKSESEASDSIEEIKESEKKVSDTNTVGGEADSECDDLEEDEKSENASESGQKNEEDSQENSLSNDEQEDKQFSLLRYLGIAKGENPYVVESSSDTTSSTDVASILNLHKEAKNGNVRFSEQEEALWKILEGASPTLWMDKDKWKRIQSKAKEKVNIDEDGGPLSWNDQLHQQNEKVLKPRTKQDANNKNAGANGRTPVIYHKFVDYEKLPKEFVHLTSNGYRPHSSVAAVDKDLNVSSPSKGFQSTIVIRPKTSKSVTNETSNAVNDKLPPRPFTTQPLIKPERDADDVEKSAGLEVSDIMRLAAAGDGSQVVPNVASRTGKQVNSPKHDDVTEEELEAIRMEAAHKMRMTGGSVEDSGAIPRRIEPSRPTSQQNDKSSPQQARKSATEKSVTLNSLPVKSGGLLATVDIRPSKPRSSMPISSLNLMEMEDHNVVNGPNPTPSQSARPNECDEVEEIHEKITGILKNKSGREAPLNSPKTQLFHSTFYKDENFFSSPKHHDPHSPSSATTSRMMTDISTSRINRAPKSASFASRSSALSPRSTVHQSINSATKQMQSRASEGFVGSPLTSKPPSRHSNKLMGGSVRSSKPNKPGLSVIPLGNTYADLITKSGFIQISHPVNFSQHHKSAANNAGSGSKMYDSYMRELSSRSGKSGVDADSEAQKSGTVIGKRLGGTSGKLLPEYARKPRQQHSDTHLTRSRSGHVNNTGFGGRKSGLALTYEQARLHNTHGPPAATEDIGGPGSLSLGLQGDQLRLNLDKNIHVIYKDLGIPKKSSKQSSVVISRQNSRSTVVEKPGSAASDKSRLISQRSCSAKSRPYSAKSEQTLKPVSDIDDVTLESELHLPIFSPPDDRTQSSSENLKLDIETSPDSKGLTEHSVSNKVSGDSEMVTAETPHQSRNSSANSKISTKLLHDVVDFGTQWSPHEPLQSIASERRQINATKNQDEANATEAELTVATDDKIEPTIDSHSEDQNEPAEPETVKETVTEPVEVAKIDEQKDEERKGVESKVDEFVPETLKNENNLKEQQEIKIVEESENVETAETELPEDQEVRGVTKVTVNIAISG